MSQVEIHLFRDAWAEDFRRLNEEWLERYFRIEPIDARVLGDPRAHIIDPGGQIFFAVEGDQVLGTCAVKAAGDRRFELTKMAVTSNAQGKGVGRRLLDAACDWYLAGEGECLFLESHSSLGAALALYESSGFEHRPRPFTSDYERADVYMEWQRPVPHDSA
ncbi:MAG: GNAT family N-acetyltransferase [Pseudomonadota bacterium]